MTREQLKEQAEGISLVSPYKLNASILVKPLKQEFVERTTIKQVEPSILAQTDYKANPEDDDLPDGYERRIEKGPSMLRNGIVVGLPHKELPEDLKWLKLGDIITFTNASAMPMELIGDAVMVATHHVIAQFTGNLSRLEDFKEEESEVSENPDAWDEPTQDIINNHQLVGTMQD